ncbi:alpha-N-acetylgalactosaminidase-like [Tribolium madens]|uniref:alpha-N-acetylgalactosaminidase-like n=1 Tax=Tribolium madens TaxID=41895 RepID=UPI001CF71D51|nr:alpha-N-acetylgalactosaminidase-like [Tribolium madens]
MLKLIPVVPIFLHLLSQIDCLDNGLALTPPMGWMHWERFRCITDCATYPTDCISERLFRDMADKMASDGFLDAGYEYVIVDDCWLAMERDSEGRLQPDPGRFPSGIKALADYVHAKGLKFGIYEDYGTKTCGGYPGSIDHLALDAQTFADWGVDYLKLDGCYADLDGMEDGYAEMEAYLNQTRRPIVFSCSFPAYKGLNANYSAAVEHCNLWRNYGDIQDSWDSVAKITDWFSLNQVALLPYAGPGHWNDPDMLIIGNYGLSYDQSVAQMAIWSVMAAPLIMSVDLRTIKPEFRDILLNKDAIRINQDVLGNPGVVKHEKDSIRLWVKELVDDSYAIGIASYRVDGKPYQLEIVLKDLGLDNEKGFLIKNVFDDVDPISVSVSEPIKVLVNPTGGVLWELTPLAKKKVK